jgi:hypothetical protein
MIRYTKIAHILAFITSASTVYAEVTQRQYCNPFDLSKSRATPVAISADNQSQISEALINGYILGLESNALTMQLSDNPSYIFPLTHELLGSYAYQYFNSNNSSLQQSSITSVVVNKGLASQPLIVDQTYVVSTIMQNTLTPMVLLPSSITSKISFPGTQAATTNSANNYYANNTSNNDDDSLPNYKYIKDNYLCTKDPTSNISSSGSSSSTKDISQIIIDSNVLMEQLNSCSIMVTNSAGDTSSSTSSNTATSSMSTNSKQGGTIGATTTTSCDFAVAACEMRYYQNNIANNISSYIESFKGQFPNQNTLYNDTLQELNKITAYDLTKYTVAGLTYPSDCTLTPTCGSSSCYTSTNVTSDAPQLATHINNVNILLKKMYAVKINSLIQECSDSKSKSSQSANSNRLLANNFSIADILNTDSFGVASSDNPFACSDKSSIYTTEQTQRAINFITSIKNLAEPESLIVPNIPLGSDVIVTGSLANTYNSDNFTNASTAVVAINTNRTILLPKIVNLREKYQKDLNNYLVAQNLATGNLYKILERRVDALDVPLFKSNFTFDNDCSSGMNSTRNNKKCEFKTPHDNISSLANVLAGQQCTAMEVMHKEALWRNQFIPSDQSNNAANLNPWQQMISSGSAADLDRAELFLLAEIKKQQWLNHEIEEEINVTLAVINILNFYPRVSYLASASDTINADIKKWIQGGKSSS